MDGFTKIFIVLMIILFISFIMMIFGIVKIFLNYNNNRHNIPIPSPTPIHSPTPIPSPTPSPIPDTKSWSKDQLNNAKNIINNFFKIFVPNKQVPIDNDCFNTFISNYIYTIYSFEDFENLFNIFTNNTIIPTDDNITKITSIINYFFVTCDQNLEWNHDVTDLDLKNLLPSILDDDSKFTCIKNQIINKYTYFQFSFLLNLFSKISTIAKSEDDLPDILKDFMNYLPNITNVCK